MDYIEVNIDVKGQSEQAEILTALLAELGFESFVEEENALLGYIPEQIFDEVALKDIFYESFPALAKDYSWKKIPQTNWNAVWESNYEPVFIDNKVCIRAPFHPKPENMELDLIIEPKMSFGTAHHPTTAQMIQLMLEENFENKMVLDMGCGTAVLAIVASKKGCNQVDAVDIDEWSCENSQENAQRNSCENIAVFQGDASFLNENRESKYDIILANINKNILLRDLSIYEKRLKIGGLIFMSGFYESDLSDIDSTCKQLSMKLQKQSVSNNWCAAIWQKN
ncbi:MAG: 50S ribosomal protein L11 methyltransferase [Bacteroidales bacterium]|nr:50S ribosomal protein L11 methyltransferase [Bacteroidales bacterium]